MAECRRVEQLGQRIEPLTRLRLPVVQQILLVMRHLMIVPIADQSSQEDRRPPRCIG
jgi:hypothetical protein